MPLIKKKVLIVVRTYPIPANPGIEVSCTAGITEEGEWIRLYPMPYRYLEADRRFRKYQWIEVAVERTADSRPESYCPSLSSINILTEPLSTKNHWDLRKELVLPLQAHCMCCLQKARNENGSPTLGLVRPAVIKQFRIIPTNANWTTEQLQILGQGHLFHKDHLKELEKIPFDFAYRFFCDHDGCKGHAMRCTDWEIAEAWRQWSRTYKEGWEKPFRQKFQTEMIEKLDTYFFVGTVQKHPGSWIIIGLFYPTKEPGENFKLF